MKRRLLCFLIVFALCVSPASLASAKSFQGLEEYMVSKKAVSGEKIEMYADIIGAKQGVKYLKQGVEIYEFKPNSKKLKKIKKTMSVNVYGINVKVSAVKGNYILFCNKPKYSKKAIKVFKKY